MTNQCAYTSKNRGTNKGLKCENLCKAGKEITMTINRSLRRAKYEKGKLTETVAKDYADDGWVSAVFWVESLESKLKRVNKEARNRKGDFLSDTDIHGLLRKFHNA